MKIKRKIILEKHGKILCYRVYKKIVTIRGSRKSEWWSWQIEAENKLRNAMERRMVSFKEPGVYRLARVRTTGVDWLIEIAR